MTGTSEARAVEIGMDWLTAVSRNEQGGKNLEELYRVREVEAMLVGFLPKFEQRYGYEGFRCGQVFFGRRGESSMLIVSSGDALQIAPMVDWENCHATRIDLQVTSWNDYAQDWAARQKEQLEAAIDVNEGNKLPEPVLIAPRKGKGDTLAIGSRSSPRYGRLYDKGAESGEEHYKNSWRYEVEYKGDAVPHILRGLRAQRFSTDWILRTVAGQFDNWHISRTFHTSSPIRPAPLGKRKTDLQRKLEWLSQQVRGTVDKLRENGLEYKALEALGFVPTSTDHDNRG
jgi:hypothetical protein